MLINMSPCGSTLEEQLSSIMDALAKAAVSEIGQLFSEGSATLRLQITRSLKENEALRTRMKVMKRELLSLRFQTKSFETRAASRLAPAQANICRPRTEPLGNEDSNDFEGHSTQRCATSESQHVVDHSLAMSVKREELTVQQTPYTVLIKDEEDIGGGIPPVEDCDDFGDCSTQHGATSESLPVVAPGSSHMSGQTEELRILSFYGKGEGPLAVDGHDTPFTVSEVEALNSLSADHSVAKSLEHGERLVSSSLKLHMRTDSGEEPYGCDLCMKRFSRSSGLKLHMRIHSGEKPYRCDQCMKRFSRSSYLKLHMRTHSREKPYRCDQCMKRFGFISNLKRHMTTHTGEKPYRCDQCMKSFRQSSYLKSHMRTHSGEKPYRCDQCMKRFSQSCNLKSHMRTHSGKKPQV